jgi:hypothetical protein
MTSELTRMIVFIHFQLIRSSYQSSLAYGDVSRSFSSMYTGMITTENLHISICPCPRTRIRARFQYLQHLRRSLGILQPLLEREKATYAAWEKTGPFLYRSQSHANLIPVLTTYPRDRKWWYTAYETRKGSSGSKRREGGRRRDVESVGGVMKSGRTALLVIKVSCLLAEAMRWASSRLVQLRDEASTYRVGLVYPQNTQSR